MKVVLTIAGSDSGSGAGIQADLKTFEAHGVFGASAVTVLTAQNTTGVRGIFPVDSEFVKMQVEAVLEDFDVAAIKIGMLYDSPIIEAVGTLIERLDLPIVLDPVFVSKAGAELLKEEAVDTLKSLIPLASLVTPNQHEAHRLFGYRFGDNTALEALMRQTTPILIKNHRMELPNGAKSIDQLFFGHQKRIFQTPFVETDNLHGTGCSYSSAIAANLALGMTLEAAIERAKNYIYHALLEAPGIGHGPGPIGHRAGMQALGEGES